MISCMASKLVHRNSMISSLYIDIFKKQTSFSVYTEIFSIETA